MQRAAKAATSSWRQCSTSSRADGIRKNNVLDRHPQQPSARFYYASWSLSNNNNNNNNDSGRSRMKSAVTTDAYHPKKDGALTQQQRWFRNAPRRQGGGGRGGSGRGDPWADRRGGDAGGDPWADRRGGDERGDPWADRRGGDGRVGGRGGGRVRGGGRGGDGRSGGRGFQGRGGGRGGRDGGRGGRGFHPRVDNESPPPTVDKGEALSITIAKKGAAKYCYGCGASLVKKAVQEADANNISSKVHGAVSIGVKTSTGGYWQQKKTELDMSKIKNWALCPRCKTLKKGNVSVGDEASVEALSPSHEMTQVFQKQVSVLRSKPDAVVVLCVDAINIRGSLLRTLRKYIGGNPILLAVTRCDLLPEYVKTEDWSHQQKRLKAYFTKQAEELQPAGVYFCSITDGDGGFHDPDFYDEDIEDHNSSNNNKMFNGTYELAKDLWDHLDGRDPYVVGAANIGKSTLTDCLINYFIARHTSETRNTRGWHDSRSRRSLTKKEEKKRRFGKKSESDLDRRRFEAIQESRVTKSSLPGTTLQNIRVPCFPDHLQALWDTPGLLMDQTLAHFPIRDYRRIKAMRPTQIQPQWHTVDEKSFALVVFEDSAPDEQPLPLLRIEVRLKRDKKDEEGGAEELGPVQLVWNSTLNLLATDTRSIEQCVSEEKNRFQHVRQEMEKEKEEAEKAEEETVALTPEERVARKKQKQLEWLQQQRAEKEELGLEEFKRKEEAKKDEDYQKQRLKGLARLKKVGEQEMKGGTAMDIDVVHFGSLGIVCPRQALVRVFAPSDGTQISFRPQMVVPPQWEDHITAGESDEEEDWDDGDEVDWDDEDDVDDWGGDWNNEGFGFEEPYDFEEPVYSEGRNGFPGLDKGNKRRWEDLSGEAVGWVFHEKPHYHRGDFVDGWQPAKDDKPAEE